jgi:predicted CoA-binding protein
MARIDEFFQHERYALVEVDPGDRGFGSSVYERLAERGRRAYVVMATPTAAAESAAGTVYTSLRDVPGPLDGVLLNIENDPQRMLAEVQTAVELGVPRIWLENRCRADDAVQYALDHGVEVVDNVCSLLALEPEHVHWLHRRVLDLFHKTPQPKVPARA